MNRLLDLAVRSGLLFDEFNDEILKNYACLVGNSLVDKKLGTRTQQTVKFGDRMLIIKAWISDEKER